MLFNGSVYRLNYPCCLHGIGNTPTYDVPAVDVDNGTQVHVATAHRNVTDINAPSLVGTDELNPTADKGTYIWLGQAQLYVVDSTMPQCP